MNCSLSLTRLTATVSLAMALGLANAAAAPARKPRHAPAASASRDIEPDITATIAKRPAAPPADAAGGPGKADDATTLPPPFRLPVASRARVRDCGLKWQAMKMSGDAGDDIWRDFATRCLTAANGPLDKR